MKTLHHRIQVNIAKKNGTKEAVIGSCIRRVPARLIHDGDESKFYNKIRQCKAGEED